MTRVRKAIAGEAVIATQIARTHEGPRASERQTDGEQRLLEAGGTVGIGSCEFSLDVEAVSRSDGFRRLHGVKAGESFNLAGYMARVHPEDRERLGEAVILLRAGGRATTEYRVKRLDGAMRTLRVDGELVESVKGDGRCYLQGTALDVTDECQAFDVAAIGMVLVEPLGLRVVRVNDAMCAMLGREREELLGLSVSDLTHPDDRTPTTSGEWSLVAGRSARCETETRYVRGDASTVWVAVYVTPVRNPDGSVRVFSTQVIDISSAKKRIEKTQVALREAFQRLVKAGEYRDGDTHEHSDRVARTSEQLGRAIGMPKPRSDLLLQAAPLHDIGKIGISDAILFKPGRFTPGERMTMQSHTLIGADILSESTSAVFQLAEQVALTHHERWDGSGYPNGLSGNSIPLAGRIVAIADVFDALTHTRSYKEAWTARKATAHIQSERCHHFDPKLVDTFLKLDLAATTPHADQEQP